MRVRRVVDAGLTVAVLGAMIVLHAGAPTVDDFQAPIEVSGAVGEQVEVPRLALTVSGVRLGTRLAVAGGPATMTTATTFVVVDAVATARQKPMSIDRVSIRSTDGTRYLAPGRSGYEGQELSDVPLAPGIPAHGSFVIEMPADRLAGAELEVVPDVNIFGLEPQLTFRSTCRPSASPGSPRTWCSWTGRAPHERGHRCPGRLAASQRDRVRRAGGAGAGRRVVHRRNRLRRLVGQRGPGADHGGGRRHPVRRRDLVPGHGRGRSGPDPRRAGPSPPCRRTASGCGCT